MDPACVIERYHAALLRIVAALVYMTGLDEGGAEMVPRRVWRRVVFLLRPAESCVRRLIVIASCGIAVTIRAPRVRPKYVPWWAVKNRKAAVPDATAAKRPGAPSAPPVIAARPYAPKEKTVSARAFRQRFGLACWGPARQSPGADDKRGRVPAFPLFDPPKRFDFGPARNPDWLSGGWPLPLPDDDELAAAPLCRRVAALKRALDDLDGQARRMARWRARQDTAFAPAGAGQRLAACDRESARPEGANGNNRRLSPMRPGYPPGRRRLPVHEVDDILRDCHRLALHALSSGMSQGPPAAPSAARSLRPG